MKKIGYIFCAVFSLMSIVLTSCSGLLAPEHAEDAKILRYVYDKTEKEVKSDLEYGLEGLAILCGAQRTKLSDEDIQERVTVQDWFLNEDCLGDTYTGYFIIYNVQIDEDRNYYTLISLTEFDNGHYEWSFETVERTLSNVLSYLDIE